jgi:mannan polymerase II complex MNN10 subunit
LFVFIQFYTLIVLHPSFELNAGSFLTRGHTRSVAFFDAVRAYHDANSSQDHQLSEQDCMRDIMFKGSKPFSDNVLFIPQWKMNAFPEEIKCWDMQKPWERGMFVLHFAGAWAHMEEEDPTGLLMKRYEGQIIW